MSYITREDYVDLCGCLVILQAEERKAWQIKKDLGSLEDFVQLKICGAPTDWEHASDFRKGSNCLY